MGVVRDQEAVHALKMVDARNLTVHTYNEALSLEIFKNIPNYYRLMERWLDRINEGIISV
ncbi:nucleotidyltransferase substrate binding protein [Gracilibacillus phocaeensis]|uniref:nucleotidyltransferase substrate binding protein n=1 Tax=Gracilibacillus phocaeensis TaxID=2042304 RepID=UPI001A91D0AE